MVYPPVVCTVEFMGHPAYNPISRLFWVTLREIMKLRKSKLSIIKILTIFLDRSLKKTLEKIHRSSLASNDRNNGHSSVRKFEKKRRRKGKGADIDRSNETNHRRGDRRIDSFEDFVSLPV